MGNLGESMRGKAPVFEPVGGAIIGIVSVGYSVRQVEATAQSVRQGDDIIGVVASFRHTGANDRVQLSMTDLGHVLIFEVEDQGPGATWNT